MNETIESLIERTEITTILFDERGNAVDQISDMYVVDRITDILNPEEKLATRRETHNVEIDNRGDAGVVEVRSYITDETGLESAT